jgi:hypothetical protein
VAAAGADPRPAARQRAGGPVVRLDDVWRAGRTREGVEGRRAGEPSEAWGWDRGRLRGEEWTLEIDQTSIGRSRSEVGRHILTRSKVAPKSCLTSFFLLW